MDIPVELADWLDRLPDAAAYVIEALRDAERRTRRRVEAQREVFARHGLTVTDEGVEKWRRRLRELERRRAERHAAE